MISSRVFFISPLLLILTPPPLFPSVFLLLLSPAKARRTVPVPSKANRQTKTSQINSFETNWTVMSSEHLDDDYFGVLGQTSIGCFSFSLYLCLSLIDCTVFRFLLLPHHGYVRTSRRALPVQYHGPR